MIDLLYPYRKITSAKNEYISGLSKLKEKKYRDRTGLFLVGGKKLFTELFSSALRNGIEITGVILTEDNIDFLNRSVEFREYYNPNKNSIILTDNAVISKLTEEKSPQGIVCAVKKFIGSPSAEISYRLDYNFPAIILDRIQNPGNLGGIMRTMNALGNFNLILAGNCADIYGEKTIRASMGAIFRQNIIYKSDISGAVRELKEAGYKIYATHLSNESVSIDAIIFNKKTAVIFGNEGSGLASHIPVLCDRNVLIPIRENAESLNIAAAAAIFLWKLKSDINLQTGGL